MVHVLYVSINLNFKADFEGTVPESVSVSLPIKSGFVNGTGKTVICIDHELLFGKSQERFPCKKSTHV